MKLNWISLGLWWITFDRMGRGVWDVSLCYIKQLLYDAKIHENWRVLGFFFSYWNRISFTLDRSLCLSNSLTEILLLHNELHQQPMHHLKNNFGQKTITHWSSWREPTHLQKGSWTNQDTSHFWSHTRSGLAELNGEARRSKINPDVDPRGLHSFIKTCHSLTFTPCWNNWLLGSRSEA